MQPDLATFQRRFVAALDAPAVGPLAVYRNTVIHGAVEALHSNYPVVAEIVGEEMFEGIAVEFSAAHPPRSPVLAAYGEKFAEWLGGQAWIDDLVYLPDVARVERLHVESLMSADAAALRAVPEDLSQLKLQLHPAARFSWLQTPAMSIWLAHQRPVPSVIDPEWKPEGALFVRPTPFVVHTPRIGAAAHRFLAGVRLGERVDRALLAADRLYPDEDVNAVFVSLVNMGVFQAPSSERH